MESHRRDGNGINGLEETACDGECVRDEKGARAVFDGEGLLLAHAAQRPAGARLWEVARARRMALYIYTCVYVRVRVYQRLGNRRQSLKALL